MPSEDLTSSYTQQHLADRAARQAQRLESRKADLPFTRQTVSPQTSVATTNSVLNISSGIASNTTTTSANLSTDPLHPDIPLPPPLVPIPLGKYGLVAPPGVRYGLEPERGNLYGVVTDINGARVGGVSVSLISKNYPYGEVYHAVTAADGTYYLDAGKNYGVAKGDYFLTFSWTSPGASSNNPGSSYTYIDIPQQSITIKAGDVLRHDENATILKGIVPEYTGEHYYPGQGYMPITSLPMTQRIQAAASGAVITEPTVVLAGEGKSDAELFIPVSGSPKTWHNQASDFIDSHTISMGNTDMVISSTPSGLSVKVMPVENMANATKTRKHGTVARKSGKGKSRNIAVANNNEAVSGLLK